MPDLSPESRDLLRLTLTPGLGPVLISRAITALGSAAAVLAANEHTLQRVKGIGPEVARQAVTGFRDSQRLADDELALADKLGVRIIAQADPEYPPLLKQIFDAPPLLYIRGRLHPADPDRYPIAIVGSRECSHYGLEQASRFATALAECGLAIVSGGARGIDTAAHRGALRVNGRTIAVLGCGLAECYPPENLDLFDQIAGQADAGHGAIISELPLRTSPEARNFPARNRIISGMSLGVLVIEAGRRSGALITARLAAEDHGREVFALPSRLDSTSAEGSLDLLKSGGAALVTHPDDILSALESPARHHFTGTHAARYANPAVTEGDTDDSSGLFDAPTPPPTAAPSIRDVALTESQRAILSALEEPRSFDQLAQATGALPASLRADVTILEIKHRVHRRGSLVARTTP